MIIDTFLKKIQYNIGNIDMISMKHLKINQMLALNNQ